MKFLIKLLLTVAIFAATASLAADTTDLSELFSEKHTITQDNFDLAMNIVAQRPGGEYVAEKLRNRLAKFVGLQLSTNEWAEEVHKAYIAFLQDMDPIGSRMILMNHPVEAIVMATIWAIPSL